jgi:leucyl-tRNA synthetase
MVLYDLKHIKFEEPFPWFFAHGLMIRDGAKMSKSRGNVVNPDKYIEKFGADAFRLYLMFIGPMDGSPDFRDTGMEGMRRFVERVWRLFEQYPDVVLTEKSDSEELLIKMHQTIKKVTGEIQHFRYNTAIAAIMEYVNLLKEKGANKEALRTLTQLLAPFAPHMTEEIWVNILGEKFSIHTSPWPKYDADLTKEIQIVVVAQVDGRMRSQLTLDSKQSKDKKEVIKLAKEDSKIQKWLKNKKIKDVVFVPGKIVNFVTK